MKRMGLREKALYGVVPVLIGLLWAGGPGSVGAEYDTSSWREICAVHGGSFERSWAYNDQGMKWGETLSCAVDAGTITCRGGLCQIGRGSQLGEMMSMTGDRAGATADKPFPAEPHAFSAALFRLSATHVPAARHRPTTVGRNETSR